MSSPGVHWIEPKSKNAPLNWSGKSLILTGATQAFNGAAQPNPSRVVNAIPLSASSIIGLADTGITRQNCYFCSSAEGNSCYNRAATSDASRNIFVYWFLGADQCAQCGRCGTAAVGTVAAQSCGNDFDENGHGTHVAATIVGSSNQVASPDSVRNNGIAGANGTPSATSAGARLFFQDILNNSTNDECAAAGLRTNCGGELSLPTALENLFVDPYANGVRVHCNSWGCVGNSSSDACNTYNSQARDIDAFNAEGSARNRQDFLIIVAAGNNGIDRLDGTVSAPSTCKNCLAVGASEKNADQISADAVYVDSNIFCSGQRQPSPCCSGRGAGRCTSNDCCDAAAAVKLCFECCRTLCVAASAPSSQNLAFFSSRGPTSDGRLKPDIVAPGSSILSANTLFPGYPLFGNYSGEYCNMNPTADGNALRLSSGSSSAAAFVAGAAEYVRQYFLQVWFMQKTKVVSEISLLHLLNDRDSIRRVPLLLETVSQLFLRPYFAP
jgi:subtilisin family serine protease